MEHTNEELKTMKDYQDSFDKDLYDYVNGVLNDCIFVNSVTVGFMSQRQIDEIRDKTGIEKVASRCVLDADSIKHIYKKHGKNGTSDSSLENIADIAKIPYILSNYDEMIFEGNYSTRIRLKNGEKSPHITIRKRIDGTYYVVEAVTDAKTMKNYIVTAYITKK